jgi:hypothetical protein
MRFGSQGVFDPAFRLKVCAMSEDPNILTRSSYAAQSLRQILFDHVWALQHAEIDGQQNPEFCHIDNSVCLTYLRAESQDQDEDPSA